MTHENVIRMKNLLSPLKISLLPAENLVIVTAVTDLNSEAVKKSTFHGESHTKQKL